MAEGRGGSGAAAVNTTANPTIAIAPRPMQHFVHQNNSAVAHLVKQKGYFGKWRDIKERQIPSREPISPKTWKWQSYMDSIVTSVVILKVNGSGRSIVFKLWSTPKLGETSSSLIARNWRGKRRRKRGLNWGSHGRTTDGDGWCSLRVRSFKIHRLQSIFSSQVGMQALKKA